MRYKMPGGEDASKRQSSRCEDICGLLEYLKWREGYDQSDKKGKLGFLFCSAFGVENSKIQSIENDLLADGLIRSSYCYDDFVMPMEG